MRINLVEPTDSAVSMDVGKPITDQEKSDLAQDAKKKGNKLYGEKKFAEAIDYYNIAIELSPAAVYYSNLAACHANLVFILHLMHDSKLAR